MRALRAEFNEDTFSMPVGLFLVVDDKNGGNSVAQEIRRRFGLLDFESRKFIDFYFLGWSPSSGQEIGIEFDLPAFEECRAALRDAGVSQFGGNADLVLLDAQLSEDRVWLDFTSAMHIDIAGAVDRKDFLNAGAFLQAIMNASEEIRRNHPLLTGTVFDLSDRIGLAIAKHSLLEYILERWAKAIGGSKLASVTTKKLGPRLRLGDL
jgi:hypothetical protein